MEIMFILFVGLDDHVILNFVFCDYDFCNIMEMLISTMMTDSHVFVLIISILGV